MHLWKWCLTSKSTSYSIVRNIACGYLGVPPEQIHLRYLPSGKPFFHGIKLHFNLSHTDGKVLAAFAIFLIGVDIENHSRSVSASKIADRYFHFSERIALATCSEEERRKLFLRMWVQKEATVKMAGDRIASGLQKVKLTVNACPWKCHRDGRKIYIQEIIPWQGMVGALAARCPFVVITFPAL